MSPNVSQTVIEPQARNFAPVFKTGLKILLVLLLMGGLFLPYHSTMASTIPTFNITSVVVDDNVTITTSNYPSGVTFTVRMGEMGTEAVGGIVVGTFDSGAGGSFTATFDIPDALKGDQQIAIRTDGETGGWFAFNWFWNNTSSTSTTPTSTPVPGATATPVPFTGIPTFSILAVTRNVDVTIRAHNYPSGQIFTARMGVFGTAAVGGIVVGQFDSGSGGDFDVTFSIPAELANLARIAIRTDSPEGFFAFNWFWNNTTSTSGGSTSPTATPVPGATATPVPPAFTGTPTFSITSVVRDDSVTITTNNFPANETFTVRMGPFGTAAVGGIEVATTDSGSGGSFTATYAIPDSLKGSSRIAIRMDSPNGFFAFNWFWNNTAN